MATKKISLNELRSIVKQIIKEYEMSWSDVEKNQNSNYDYFGFNKLTEKYGIVGLPFDNKFIDSDILIALGLNKPIDSILDGEKEIIGNNEYVFHNEFEDSMVDGNKIKDKKILDYYNKLKSEKEKMKTLKPGELKEKEKEYLQKMKEYYQKKEKVFGKHIDIIGRFINPLHSASDVYYDLKDAIIDFTRLGDNKEIEYTNVILKPALLKVEKMIKKIDMKRRDFSPERIIFNLFGKEFNKKILPQILTGGKIEKRPKQYSDRGYEAEYHLRTDNEFK